MRKFVFGGSYASFVGLLDLYPATVAYSLRKLRSSVTNVIRVRRTGDNLERDFTADEITNGTLVSWVISGGGLQNGRVVIRYDQTGNGIHSTQSNAANQPFIVENGVLNVENGKPCIKKNLSTSNVITYMVSPYTFPTGDILTTNVFVGKRISGTSINNAICAITPNIALSSDRRYINKCIETNTTFAVRNEGGNTIFTSGSGFSQSLFSSWRDASNTDFKARRNGISLTLSSSGTSKNLNIQADSAFTLFFSGIVSYNSIPSNNVDGLIQEEIWWLSNQSANLSAIEININTYYGIY